MVLFVLLICVVLIPLLFKLCGLAPLLTFKDFLLNHGKSIKKTKDITKLNINLDPLLQKDKGYGNYLVHPSVVYIPNGLAGKKWWMAVTPYPNFDSRYEQPVLFCGKTNGSHPPIDWEFIGLIAEPHDVGFNSDPNLYFDGDKLWCFWKETKTENTDKLYNSHSIMARSYDGKAFGPIRKMANNNDKNIANVFSPTIIKINEHIYMLATAFEHERIKGSLLPFGENHIAIWSLKGENFESGQFEYLSKAVQIYPKDFNYWHAECCKVNSQCYLSVVTDEQAKRILIGVSSDGFNYKYLDTPLLSSFANNFAGLYKASITVINNDVFIFFPCRTGLLKNKRVSNIYMTTISIDELLILFKNKI